MTITEFDGPDGLRWGRIEVGDLEFRAFGGSLFNLALREGIKMVCYDARMEPGCLAGYGPLLKQPEAPPPKLVRRAFDKTYFDAAGQIG